ncbi:MAG: metalloregulator ArsR/SmtB family transcription factor [Oscillospiraceae bacterium]|nr:metalloregulator ArsR/SmtB family transcription factor [Oscillospiraceae bacterium]
MSPTIEKQAKIFNALADERRLRILSMLKGCERCACAIKDELDLPQSSLSYHMKILCDSGLVTDRREGKWTYYSINRSGCMFAAGLIETIPTVDGGCCPHLKGGDQ